MIAEDNDVTIPQIKQWIREERLIFTEDSIVGIECENCGTMIRTGRFCKACKDGMANNMSQLIKANDLELQEKRKLRENVGKDVMRCLDTYEKK